MDLSMRLFVGLVSGIITICLVFLPFVIVHINNKQSEKRMKKIVDAIKKRYVDFDKLGNRLAQSYKHCVEKLEKDNEIQNNM